jgi:hypothetical protein
VTEPGARAPALHLGGSEGIASAVRRALPLLALAGCAALLPACGKSSYSGRSSGSAAVARPARKVSTLNRPQALAYVHAVNLTAADVPGFTVSSSKESGTAKEKQLERELLRCVGPAGSAGKLAQAGSKEFELSHGILQLSVSSEVSVSETPAMAARELTAIRSAHVRGCFAHYLGLLLKGQHYGGAAVGPVSVLSGTPPAPGTTGGFGWRLTATLTIRGLTVPFYLDILGFVYGQATVSLFSSGAVQPFPATAEQHLFTLLLHRAKVHHQ